MTEALEMCSMSGSAFGCVVLVILFHVTVILVRQVGGLLRLGFPCGVWL
jgi:hypothetical protein